MRTLLTILLYCYVLSIYGQEEWTNHTAIATIGDIETYDNKAYVTNTGGLLIIDLDTNEEELLVPANSGLDVMGTSEIEILSNGDAWISGYRDGGLFYYDGDEFEHFYHLNNGDSIRGLTNLLLVEDDELWFTSNLLAGGQFGDGWYADGKLYSNTNGDFKDYGFQFPDGVRTFCADNDNRVWVPYQGNLYVFDNGSFSSQIAVPPYNEERDRIDQYFIDSQGIHWLSFYDNTNRATSLWKYENGTWLSFSIPSGLKIFFETDGTEISFATNNVIGNITDDNLTIDSTHHVYSDIPFRHVSPQVLNHVNENDIWFSNFNGASDYQVYRVTDAGTTAHGKNSGFLGASWSIAMDCDENLYASRFGTLQRFSDNEWFTYSPDYRGDCNIRSVITNPYTCETWGYFSPSGECMSLWKIGLEEVLEIDIVPDAVTTISFDRDGNVFLSIGVEVLRIDALGILTTITHPQMRWAFYSYMSSRDELWIIGQDHNFEQLMLMRQNGIWTTFDQTDSPLSSNITTWSYEDNEENIWFQNEDGLYFWDNQRWVRKPLPFMDDTFFTDMVQDADGNYWVATSGKGIAYWDGVDFTFYNTENSDILSDDCFQLELLDKELWITHNFGLSQMTIGGVSSTQTPPTALPESHPQFTLYPNPSSGIIHVKSETLEEKKYTVYSTTGELVLSDTSDKEIWSTTLDPGVYIVKVSDGASESVQKLVISN